MISYLVNGTTKSLESNTFDMILLFKPEKVIKLTCYLKVQQKCIFEIFYLLLKSIPALLYSRYFLLNSPLNPVVRVVDPV